MGFYFEDHHSMFSHTGMNVELPLRGIASRYVAQNPAHPLTFRAFNRRGILRGGDYRYRADFNELFPKARHGSFVYAWAKIWSDNNSEILFDINCHSPTVIYVNDVPVFRSTIFEERYPDKRQRLKLALQAGWNHFVIRFRKTRAGFGGIFGTWLGKLPYYFLLPTGDREGQEGWLYSDPQAAELSALPTNEEAAGAQGVVWHPRGIWSREQQAMGQLKRIFGAQRGLSAVGWTCATFARPGAARYTLRGRHQGPLKIFVGDTEVYSADRSGAIATSVKVPFGRHDVMARCECAGTDWGFEIEFRDGDRRLEFSSPCNLQGSKETWIYAGPLARDQRLELARLRDLHQLVPTASGPSYWRLDAPDEWVRAYNDNPLYGKWNYPLGVTLYGLFHSARAIGSREVEQYVVDHIQHCCDTYDYAMWDREQYGGATNVHHLLTSLDSLDDCGSFGSAMLDVAQHAPLRDFRPIADLVADHITKRQVRLPDGTFFRKHLMHEFHEDTMWADDLYMSVPFLCRYYQLTGDTRYIDDAARQFLGFKERLYIPELKIMSHVFDFTRNMATGIPWGRGNGWVIFSLSELLAVLPETHELRPQLLDFFRELSSGYLALQDEAGMWHQVLNEHDSYPETSCTSMFAYAFARGVRFGWLEKPEPYIRSVLKAWEALIRISIDWTGNIFGVCRGSEFSFQSEYYKKDLLWNLNDTHGIGIVLLAGVEVLRLTRHLQEEASAAGGDSAERSQPRAPRKVARKSRARAVA